MSAVIVKAIALGIDERTEDMDRGGVRPSDRDSN